MRIIPRRHSRVVWEEGMYLAPHHFQAQRRHHEETTAEALSSLVPFAYGVTAASLDTEALAGGTLALAFVRGILPDGTVVAAPESDPSPPPVPLAPRFAPDREMHVVHVALSAWRDDAPNVLRTSGNGGDPWRAAGAPPDTTRARFIETVQRIRDEVAGDESLDIHVASKRLRLVLDVELEAGDVSLPIARVRRDGVGRFVVDPTFVPPCLRVGASEMLVGVLRRVVGMVEAKGAALSASLALPADGEPMAGVSAAYIGNELATRWLLHAVRSAEGPLRHMLATRTAHPERLWLELSQLAGALCTFSLTTPVRDLPLYVHDDLGGCFAQLERHLQGQLDVVIAAQAVVIPLTRASELLHVAEVTDPRCHHDEARWFLGVQSSIGAIETAARGPQALKACARKFVLELVRRAFPGLTLEHVPSPPAALAPRHELTYFEVTIAGPCGQGLRETKEFGVYVPEAIPDAALELAILVPQ